MSYRSSLASVLPLFCFVSACTQGQHGGEIGADDDGGLGGEMDHCVDLSTTPIEGDDRPDSVPATLGQLMETIEGQFESEMKWNQGQVLFGGDVKVHPAASDTRVSVEIEVIPESGKFVDRETKSSTDQSSEEGAVGDFGEYGCADRLTVDARVTLTAENGAFRDEFLTTFWTVDGVVAHAVVDLSPGELEGSFNVDVSGLENGRAGQTRLNLAVAYGSIKGTITGVIEVVGGEATAAGGAEYGVFPKDNSCQFGFPLPDDSPLQKEVQDLLDAHTEFDFRWTGEDDKRVLRVSSEVNSLCYDGIDYNDSGSILSAALSTMVVADDDTIDGAWPMKARIMLSSEGELDSVQVSRDNYISDAVDVQDFEQHFGIFGIESDADQLSFTFGFSVTASGEHPASGELTILALTVPECVSGSAETDAGSEADDAESGADAEPEAEAESGADGPDQGSGSAGCEGTLVDEIKNAQFVELREE